MADLSFEFFFRTTSKGLPNTSNIEPFSYLSMNHFIYSLSVQIIIGLVLTGYTSMSVYRAFHKIKNQKFFQSSSKEEEQRDQIKTKSDNKEGDQNTNDNLIYRFDQDENEKDKQEDKENDEDDAQAEQEPVSEQTTEWFLELDHKLLFFQPFLISFVIAANTFSSNAVIIVLLGLALALFFFINLKKNCAQGTALQILFTLPCIVAFTMIFYEDKDMST